MIKIDQTTVQDAIYHRVSKEQMKLNDNTFDFGKEEINLPKDVFLKMFKTATNTFEFTHSVDLEYNILQDLSRKIFEGESFIETTKSIANHLMDCSDHPNINDGDLFVVKFDEINLDNRFVDAIGIYKFESKIKFIDTYVDNNAPQTIIREGIGDKKPEKACLILATDEAYTILVVESGSKETDYWQKDFINHKSKEDNYNSTSEFLNITKDYITSQINSEFEVEKTDQIELLNRSVEYFKTNEKFDRQEFEKSVFADEEVIESFQQFNHVAAEKSNMIIPDSFDIAEGVVKKKARSFKSVLKLDKNFHIYIHGDRKLIEQGTDENGRKFYKIYYQEES
jgi:hypothetical protein